MSSYNSKTAADNSSSHVKDEKKSNNAGNVTDDKSTSTPSSTYKIAAGKRDINQLLYSRFCSLLDAINAAKRKQKEQILIDFWREFDVHQDWYPLIRLLIPGMDSDRHTYGIKEYGLADCYAAALGLNKQTDQFQRLKHYKNPKYHQHAIMSSDGTQVQVGEFSTILEDVLKPYIIASSSSSSKLTITDINKLLDDIAHAGNNNDKPTLRRCFTICVTQLTAHENMWLSRIILGDLKIGLRHESVLKLFHPRAMDAFNTTSSLRHVCKLVRNPQQLLSQVSTIGCGLPFKPMLCSTPDWRDIIALMKGEEFTVEPKFDGERIIIHKYQGKIQLFSRNSIDFTNRYNYGQALQSIIRQALPEHDCIIDGELVAYNPLTGRYLRFGTNRSVALGEESLEEGAQFCYQAFDCVMYNDMVLVDTPLKERYKILLNLVKQVDHRFEVVKQERPAAYDTLTVMSMLDDALLRGVEGLILKQSNSKYGLNERSEKWMKLKPEFVHGLKDTLDVILLGGYYGEGTRRSGDISHFMIGVAANSKPHSSSSSSSQNGDSKAARPSKFYCFGKVGSGYTLKELSFLRERLSPHWLQYNQQNPPSFMCGWRGEKKDQPNVYIEPHNSILISLHCMEVVECEISKFNAGYTARFPRVEKFRYDKPWYECITIDEIVSLYNSQRAKHGHVNIPEYLRSICDEDARRAGLLKVDENGAVTVKTEEGGAKTISAKDVNEYMKHRADDLDHSKTTPVTKSYLPADPSNHAAYDWQVTIDKVLSAAQQEKEAHLSKRQVGTGSLNATFRGTRGGKRKKEDDGTKVSTRRGGVNQVISSFKPTDVTHVTVRSELLNGLSFSVMSPDPVPSKEELETLIVQHGGKFTQNPIVNQTTAILTRHDLTMRVQSMKESGLYDILHYSWLVDSINANTLLPYMEKYLIYATDATKANIRQQIDEYGDDYSKDVSVEAMDDILHRAKRQERVKATFSIDDAEHDDEMDTFVSPPSSKTTPTNGSTSKRKNGRSTRVKQERASPQPQRAVKRLERVSSCVDENTEGGSESDTAAIRWMMAYVGNCREMKKELTFRDVENDIELILQPPTQASHSGSHSSPTPTQRFTDSDVVQLQHPYSLFSSCHFYIYPPSCYQRNLYHAMQTSIRLYGGTLHQKLTLGVTHVVLLVDGDEKSSSSNQHSLDPALNDIKQQFTLIRSEVLKSPTAAYKYPYIVKSSWVTDCIRQETVLDTADYLPKTT